MPRPFLTAHWSHLFLATYPVPPGLLEERLPPGLELDTRDGQAFVSLVAFEFLDTRVLGLPWPGYRDFTELNLRFYVRHGDDRGVVFVREFVPHHLVAWLARALYNEPYRAAPLTSSCREEGDRLTMEYRLRWGGREHVLTATGGLPPVRPGATSAEHFFKEHRWGFGMTRSGRTLRYEVAHPVWEVFPVLAYRIDLDWATVYGPEWAFLNEATPSSTILATGSAVSVYPKGKLLRVPVPTPAVNGI
jgi:uncharacterized protein YqjF (DUF2071 family)